MNSDIKVLMENDDNQSKLIQMMRLGLVDRTEVSKLIAALHAANADKTLTTTQKDSLLGLLNKLTNLITSDTGLFNRAKSLV